MGFGTERERGRDADPPDHDRRISELRRRMAELDLESAREATEGVLDQLYLDRRPSDWDLQELVAYVRSFDALRADLEEELGGPLQDLSVAGLHEALEQVEGRAPTQDRAALLRRLANVEGPASIEDLLVQVRAAATAGRTGSGDDLERRSLLALAEIIDRASSDVDDERLMALDATARAGLSEVLHPVLMPAAAGRLRLPPAPLGPPEPPARPRRGEPTGHDPGGPEGGDPSPPGPGAPPPAPAEPPSTGAEPSRTEPGPDADPAADERAPPSEASRASALVTPVGAAAAAVVGLVLAGLGAWRLGLLVLAALVAAAAELGPSLVVAAVTMALLAGARLPLTGLQAADAALAAGWILVVSTTFRRLDRRGRGQLPLGLGLLSAVTLLALAALTGDGARALLAAAVAGGCVALLGLRKGSATLAGRARVFLGFLLAGLALSFGSVPGRPEGPLVPLLLFAVPVLDVVVSAPVRSRGASPPARRSSHLVRRLMAPGRSRAAAMRILFGAQALLAATALLVGSGLFSWASGAVIAGMVVVAILAMGGTSSHRRPVRPGVLALASLTVLMALGAPAMVSLVRVRDTLEVGAAGARSALDAARAGNSEEAAGQFALAGDAFARARRQLSGPLPSAGLAVPVVSSNLQAVRTLADAGRDVSRSGQRLVLDADPKRLRVNAGTIPAGEIARMAPLLSASVDTVRAVATRIRSVDNLFVVAPLRQAAADLSVRLAALIDDTEAAAEAARLFPAILGSASPRRYFLAVQNNAEARATGGLIGNFGELVVEQGRIRLERFGRLRELIEGGNRDRVLRAPEEYQSRYGRFEPAKNWQNVNMSPDFPTVGSVITDLYPQSGGRPVDGVLAIDPSGLAALLELTGPVRVAGWPEPIGADNVVRVALRDAYQAFPKAERVDFLGDVASAAMQRLTAIDLGDPRHIAQVLAKAADRRHLMLYLSSADEQRLVQRLGLAGERRPPLSDSVLVVTQNVASNKVDYYLERRLRYAVDLRPDGEAAAAKAHLEVVLENKAPSRGLSAYVLGPSDRQFMPGENRTFLSVYSPMGLQAATLDGQALRLDSARELGRQVHSAVVSVPASSTRVVSLDLTGTVRLRPGGWYELEVERQPLLGSDDVEVAVSVPDGWRLAEARGMTVAGPRASTRLRLDVDRTLWLRVERGGR